MNKKLDYSVRLADHGKAEFSKANGSTIDLLVDFPHLPDGPVWFTASPDDSTEHGREIYARAIAGEFGAVKAHKAK